MPVLDTLIAALGVPVDRTLLAAALVHRSLLNERMERVGDATSNERLEFLGDAVLNVAATELLYTSQPAASEGDLTQMRAELIRASTLADFARELQLGSYLRIGRGEDRSGARERGPILSNAFEAVTAAVFLSGGHAAVQRFLLPFFTQRLAQLAAGLTINDPKTHLQHLVQGSYGITPMYRILDETGPEHRRTFTAEVLMGEQVLGSGVGLSKQAAQLEAARAALQHLEQPDGGGHAPDAQ